SDGHRTLEGTVYMITGKGESVPNTETEIDTAFKLTLISKRAKGEPRTKFTYCRAVCGKSASTVHLGA
ncbi:MAG: hypothetical protein ABIH69_07930, partial [bacterium]